MGTGAASSQRVPPGGAAAAATISAAAAGVAGTLPAAVGLLLGVKAGQEGVEKLLELLRGFFVLSRSREEEWAAGVLRRVRGANQRDVMGVLADEAARRAEFERRVTARVRRDASRVLGLPERERGAELAKLLVREQRYAESRAQAMGERVLAAADRIVLRVESPQGAFWRLGVADKHTRDCLAMAGHFWPWEVLDVFHPPTHAGCVCSLHGYGTAVGAGWMKPGDVQDVKAAMGRAAAARLLLEGDVVTDMREAVVEQGLATPGGFDRALWAAAVAA